VRYAPYLLLALVARLSDAQTPDTASRASGSVVGVVRDSLAKRPLAEALIQLVSADDPARFVRTSRSDSLGRFAINEVPAGRYMLGFFHPMLDSIGVETAQRQLYVGETGRPVQSDLGIPSPARLRAAVCGKLGPDSSGVIIGVVRDAKDGSPISGATFGIRTEAGQQPSRPARRVSYARSPTGLQAMRRRCRKNPRARGRCRGCAGTTPSPSCRGP